MNEIGLNEIWWDPVVLKLGLSYIERVTARNHLTCRLYFYIHDIQLITSGVMKVWLIAGGQEVAQIISEDCYQNMFWFALSF